jgi:GntR family transcriptional regulator of vanillate catabolism
MQHHAIVEALEAGQGARAEALMREHASAVLRFTDISPARGLTILRA